MTAWAEGCSWTEALEISGSPPGDLARSLSRVLDALRQLGNLPYRPIRRDSDDETVPQLGLDPVVRKLCRDASHLINRYPVKDTFAAEGEDEENEEEEEEEEEETEDLSDNAEDTDLRSA